MRSFYVLKIIISLIILLILPVLSDSADFKKLWEQEGGTVIVPGESKDDSLPDRNIKEPKDSEKNQGETSQQPIRPDYHTPSIPPQQMPKHSGKIPRKTVMHVQALLSNLGYDTGPIDGILGVRTRKAVQAFQRDIGIQATGKIDEMLVIQIELAVQRRKSKSNKARIKPRENEKNPQVSYGLPEMPGPLANHQLKPEDFFRKVQESVFVLWAAKSYEALKQRIGVSQGSAVAVSSSHLLTNCHVTDNKPIILVFQDEKVMIAQLAEKKDNDMCILYVTKSKLSPINGVKKFEKLVIGEKVYTIGAPKGLERTLGEGLISGLRKNKGSKLIQTSAPISGGSSGGGLFDENGNLIGITTFLFKDAQNLNFAIAVEQYWD